MRTQLPLLLLGFAIAVAVSQQPAYGSIAAKPIKELVEYFTKKFGRELAQEGAEQTTKRMTALIAKHGDEVVEIMRPLGPRAVKVADEFGDAGYQVLKVHGRNGLILLEEQGQKSLALAKQYGNGAMDVLIHQPGVGRDMVTHFPKHSFPAIAKLSSIKPSICPRWQRNTPIFQRRRKSLLAQNLAEGGDDFVAWAYKRRKELFATEVLATNRWLGSGSGPFTPTSSVTATADWSPRRRIPRNPQGCGCSL